MAETSLIDQQIMASLLSDKGKWDVVYVDQDGNRRFGEQSVEIDNPFALDKSSFIPRQEIMDLQRFFDLTRQIIDYKQKLEGVESEKRVQLVEEFNPENFHSFGNEVITWKLIRREPAKMNRDATSRPQRAGLHSHDLKLARYPNKVLEVETRPTDNEIEFSCWSKTATLANSRALWLEDLLITHRWLWTSQGVDKFWWVSRLTDLFITPSGQRLHQRPLRFKARLTEFQVTAYPAIRQTTIQLGDF